jgi:aerobic-type carbon monoxide dehydrogenase small subunit (CoxS/CutS family)
MITLKVNGEDRALDVDPSMPLLYALRNQLQLNGAKYGCGVGQCGSCTVIVDKEAVFSCQFPVSSAQGRSVRTIESLGTVQQPGPLQKAFIDKQSAQCGYCIAGMVMRAQVLLEKNGSPTDAEIRAHMEPNLCRCGTHMRIIAAVKEAAVIMRADAGGIAPRSATRGKDSVVARAGSTAGADK